jgi:hypothetical protein
VNQTIKPVILVGLVGVVVLQGCAVSPLLTVQENTMGDETTIAPATAASVTAALPPTYQAYELSNSRVHVVIVPPNGAVAIEVAVAETLTPLPEMAEAAGAIAAINAGFFDPQNGLTTSYVTIAGNLVADPRKNDRLMQNPDLQAYLPAILNRSEFRIYDCAGDSRYDIAVHDAATPTGCRLNSAVGAGPQLLPRMTGYEEGFLADDESGILVRDALGSQSANARSAVAIKADGTVVFAIASQLTTSPPTGLNFQEMADFLRDLGVEKALNLDGGSSSSVYFAGETYYGRLDDQGNPVERPIKSMLLVR